MADANPCLVSSATLERQLLFFFSEAPELEELCRFRPPETRFHRRVSARWVVAQKTLRSFRIPIDINSRRRAQHPYHHHPKHDLRRHSIAQPDQLLSASPTTTILVKGSEVTGSCSLEGLNRYQTISEPSNCNLYRETTQKTEGPTRLSKTWPYDACARMEVFHFFSEVLHFWGSKFFPKN